jgi:PadR family transcriptional regulator PadR
LIARLLDWFDRWWTWPQRELLELLEEGDSYGYLLGQGVERRTGHRPSVARLYGALRRLERLCFVTTYEADPSPERGGRPRMYYRLTEAGRQWLRGAR